MIGSGRHSGFPDFGFTDRWAGLSLALCCLLVIIFHPAFHDHDTDEHAKVPHCTVCSVLSHGMPQPASVAVAQAVPETDWSLGSTLIMLSTTGDMPEMPPGQRAPPLRQSSS